MPLTLQDYAFQKAREYQLPPDITARLPLQIQQESAWDPNAVSRAGARGLMQIMPATGRDLGLVTPSDFFDPYKNIDAGVRYLAQLARRYQRNPPPQQAEKTFAAFNWGMGNVPVTGPLPPLPAETRNYVRKIMGPVEGASSSTAPTPLPEPVFAPRRQSELRTAQPPSMFETLYNYVFGQENEGLPPAETWSGPELGLSEPQLTTGDLSQLGALPSLQALSPPRRPATSQIERLRKQLETLKQQNAALRGEAQPFGELRL